MPMEAIRVLLLVVLATPFAFALILAMSKKAGLNTVRQLAGFFAFIHLAFTITLAIPAIDKIKVGESIQIQHDLYALEPGSAVQFFVGIDGINVWLVLLTSFLSFIAILASWKTITENAHGYYAWLFVLQSAITGAFISSDLVMFYIFFELTLIPSFFLIGCWGVGSSKRDAARKFFLYTLFGSLLTLAGLIGVVLVNPTPIGGDGKPQYETLRDAQGNTYEPKAGPITFSVPQLTKNVTAWNKLHHEKLKRLDEQLGFSNKVYERAKTQGNIREQQNWYKIIEELEKSILDAHSNADQYHFLMKWLFFAFVAGFVVKVPLVPFHTWLPSAYAEAPAPVTLLFSGLMAKLGTTGLLRFAVPLFPEPAVQYGLAIFGTLGAIGIVYAALCAFAQSDIKMIAAYSSVSHLGLLALGLFALNDEGLTGAVLHMVNHGVSAGAMFVVVGFLADRFRTTDMNHYGGLIARYPVLAFFTFAICLAGVGLPGLNNFVSEMLLIGSLAGPENLGPRGYGLITAACAGLFLSAWYTMTMLKKVFFGQTQTPTIAADQPAPGDADLREWTTLGLPVLACLVLGICAQPVIDTIKPETTKISNIIKDARERVGSSSPVHHEHH